MARTTEKVTQQAITKLQDAMNASHKNMNDAKIQAEELKDSNKAVSEILSNAAIKFREDYDYLAGKIVRRLSEGLSESHVSLNKWIDSVKQNLPQA